MTDPGGDGPRGDEVDTAGVATETPIEVGPSRAGFAEAIHSPSLVFLLLVAVVFGISIGYLAWGRSAIGRASSAEGSAAGPSASALAVDLPEEFALAVSFGSIGPQLVEAGAVDYDRFVDLYQQSGRPLTDDQLEVLSQGSGAEIVINRGNARFLLNFFWALGLTNENPLLEEGPMMAYGEENIGRFASTGGWTLGTKSPVELFSSTPIVTLTPRQQARLEEVASAVYRPCCDNPTSFPDCNHGMAMLGILQLLASEDATVDEMFVAAKNINAFWFPEQTAKVAMFFQHTQGRDFAQADPRELVGFGVFSASGFQAINQSLADNGLLGTAPGSGDSCGV